MFDLPAPEVPVVSCRIESASADASALLRRFLSSWPARLASQAAEPDLRLRIEPVGDEFQLFVNDSLRGSADRPEQLIPELTRTVDDVAIHRLSGLWAVHAGVVQWQNRALLLPGGSHAGKSTLVVELLRRGATYFSDEYALFDRDGRVHPYPRPLLVRNGSPMQRPFLAEEFGAATGRRPASLGWIAFLTWKPEEAWRVTPIPQSAALIDLLRNTPHILEETPDLIRVFERAIAGAQCFAGSRPDAQSAVDSILALIEDGGR